MSDVEGMVKRKVGKGLITKTLERCKWIGRGKSSMTMMKSRSWPSSKGAKKSSSNNSCVAPEGCFSVYVGPQMKRFVIKTEYVNHPLFKILLEEAESEYGYNSQGPLALPCHVDIFYKVLMEMEYSGEEQEEQQILSRKASAGCVFLNRSPSAYHRLLRSSSVKP